MKNALIVVDFQNDFLPGGPLGVPDGDTIKEQIRTLIEAPSTDVIVFTRDAHPEDHCSFTDNPKYEDMSWPKHCVEGTEGYEIPADLIESARNTGKPVIIVDKGFDKNEEAYSGVFKGRVVRSYNVDTNDFFRTVEHNLEFALDRLDVVDTEVVGLALDYCVSSTAIDLDRAGFEPTVMLGATRPVAYLSGVTAVVEMSDQGIGFDASVIA